MKEAKDLTTRRKKKIRRLFWLAADLIIAGLIFTLLFYKPAGYAPVKIVNRRQASQYLTNELYPQLYNGAQRGEPFILSVTQKGINDIVARSGWPQYAAGASFSKPVVLFEPDSIVLMGTVVLKGAEFVVTIVVRPVLENKELLNLQLAKVKIGAVNVTPVARITAQKMYRSQTAGVSLDEQDIGVKIAASLLTGQPFEPVFNIADFFGGQDIKVRIAKITIKNKKLVLHLVPLTE